MVAGFGGWRECLRVTLRLGIFTAALLMSACAYQALESGVDEQTRATTVATSRFSHHVLERSLAVPSDTLRVYLAGDGAPWIRGRYPSRNPSSPDDPVFKLLALDDGPAVFVGRPCYHGFHGQDGCDPRLWTRARYSAEIIISMLDVVEVYIRRLQPRQVVLVGYSGGGVLALALAPLLSVSSFTLTVAGNLDVESWRLSHGYLPLDESLNPAASAAYYGSLSQLHLQGSQDRQVPPWTTSSYVDRLPGGSVRVIDGVDHRCCWETIWAAILREEPWNVGSTEPWSTSPGKARLDWKPR